MTVLAASLLWQSSAVLASDANYHRDKWLSEEKNFRQPVVLELAEKLMGKTKLLAGSGLQVITMHPKTPIW